MTKPLPLLVLVSVNQRIAPINTTIAADTLPMNIRNSQISPKYVAIRLAKSAIGLRNSPCIGFTHGLFLQVQI